jgi:hypothetical protein
MSRLRPLLVLIFVAAGMTLVLAIATVRSTL